MLPEVFKAFFGEFPNLKPVQEKSIPLLLKGKNVIISANTGAGKTEAALAPLISRYLNYALSNNCLTWLYITPTKALANDIYYRIEPILSKLHIKTAIRHGDKDETYKSKDLHFLITTPESLDVILCRGNKSIRYIRGIVLDEVHLLYNTQRGLQTSLLIFRLNKQIIHPPLQIACLSATISSCENIIYFLFGNSMDFEIVTIPSEREIESKIFWTKSEREIVELIKKIMQDDPVKLLIFANSRKQCDRLSALLSQNEQIAHHIFTHYSSLSTKLREETEREFNKSKVGICIATSTLEFGIDIGDIDGVILYGTPTSVSSFLQRIGRGNRRSNKSNAICLVPSESRKPVLEALIFYAIIDLAKEGIIEKTSPKKLYGAMVQQIFSIITANKGNYIKVKDIASISINHPHLTEDVIEEILTHTSEAGFTKPHGFKYKFGADEKLYSLIDYRLIYSNFPMQLQEIIVTHGNKEIGSIPSINFLRIAPGSVIRFAGKCWRVINLDMDRVVVEPHPYIDDALDIIYSDIGTPSTDILILNRVYEYLTGKDVNLSLFEKFIRNQISELLKYSPGILTGAVPVVRMNHGFYHITLAGEFCNRVISKANGIDHPIVDDVGLFSNKIIDFTKLSTNLNDYLDVVTDLFTPSSSLTLFQSLLPEKLKQKEFIEEWLCNSEIEKTLKRLKMSNTKLVPMEYVSWLTPQGEKF